MTSSCSRHAQSTGVTLIFRELTYSEKKLRHAKITALLSTYRLSMIIFKYTCMIVTVEDSAYIHDNWRYFYTYVYIDAC